MNELAQTLPSLNENGREKCHRAKILRQAIDYIRFIQQENNSLKLRLDNPLMSDFSTIPLPPLPSSSSSITTTPEDEHHFTSESDTSSSDESHPPTTTTTKYTPPKFDTFCFQI